MQHRHHHHHHHRQGSTTSQTSGRHDKIDQYLNGGGLPDSSTNQRRGSQTSTTNQRRGSQTSTASLSYLRRESYEAPQRSLESPRPRRAMESPRFKHRTRTPPSQSRSPDTFSVDEQLGSPVIVNRSDHMYSPTHAGGRVDHMTTSTSTTYMENDSNRNHQHNYSSMRAGDSRDEALTYDPSMSPALSIRSFNTNIDTSTSVTLTPKPRTRAFPRTNPAYMAKPRDGNSSYRKINIEQHVQPPAQSPPPLDPFLFEPSEARYEPVAVQTACMQIQTVLGGGRQDRSDSDTSHSSYRMPPGGSHEMTDSQTSNASSVKTRELSDSPSHSSTGSMRNLPDSRDSSQGSLRSAQEREQSHDGQSSPVTYRPTMTTATTTLTDHERSHSRASQRSYTSQRSDSRNHYDQDALPHLRERRNSEPDYANLPIITYIKTGKVLTVEHQPLKDSDEGVHTEMFDTNGEEIRSLDSYSPHEFTQRQDTPNSQRSYGTQNSSHTSEGNHTIIIMITSDQRSYGTQNSSHTSEGMREL